MSEYEGRVKLPTTGVWVKKDSLTLSEWSEYLEHRAEEKHEKIGRPCFCGAKLKASSVECYTHDGGVEVEGYPEKQWVYLVCGSCGHQWSFTHILRS